jgi:hypothetical protein
MAIQGIKRAKTFPSVSSDAAEWFRNFLLSDYLQLAQQVNAIHTSFQEFQIGTTVGNVTKAVTYTFPYADTNYALAAMADWNTSIWFSLKAKGGVTLNFGTASPGTNNVTLITCR